MIMRDVQLPSWLTVEQLRNADGAPGACCHLRFPIGDDGGQGGEITVQLADLVADPAAMLDLAITARLQREHAHLFRHRPVTAPALDYPDWATHVPARRAELQSAPAVAVSLWLPDAGTAEAPSPQP